MMGHTRVGLADDDLLARRALSAIIGDFDDLELLWAVEDGRRAVDRVVGDPTQSEVDVVLLDIQMPGMGGIEACRTLSRERPGLPIIMLTTFDAGVYLADALSAGATGFLTKDEAPDRIADAIRAARRGTGVFSPSATRALSAPVVALPTAKAPNPLTAKENEVLALVAESLTNQQIARRLGISEATVKTHVSAIITKLDCVDRVGMVTWAFRNDVL